jgi:hypothetical protein
MTVGLIDAVAAEGALLLPPPPQAVRATTAAPMRLRVKWLLLAFMGNLLGSGLNFGKISLTMSTYSGISSTQIGKKSRNYV